jgi:RNA polymerase sigma-70 factor (ECF subfamily)
VSGDRTPGQGGRPLDTLVDDLFRRESARMISALTRVFGTHNLELAEDVVQDALLQALRHWPFQGIPDNPSAWLYQVAKRRAIDVLRRRQSLPQTSLDGTPPQAALPVERFVENLFSDEEIEDDTLRMMFTCCHPSLALEAQVALTLNLLGGFGSAEIAHAFLVPEGTMQKRLYRAKAQIRDSRVAFEVPAGADLAPRLQAVLAVLYLMFNEGYSSSFADQPIRRDVCVEATRLCRLLMDHPAGDHPDVRALMALMCFQAARFDARVDAHGDIVVLKDQDRSRWDRALIREGFRYLDEATDGGHVGALQIEAAIAAMHCVADSYAATDWARIVDLYDQLLDLKPSPIVALNRAIAVGERDGPRAGLTALETIPDRGALERYHHYPAALGEMHSRLGEMETAAGFFERAIAITSSPAERRLLERKLRESKIPRLT